MATSWDIIEVVFGCAVAAPLGLATGLWFLKNCFDYDLIAELRRLRRRIENG